MVDDEPSKMDSFKNRLSDIGQKVGNASKKAAKKAEEVSTNIAGEIKLGAKKVSEDVKVGAKIVSETVEQKKDEFLEKREESKKAKADADDAREEELRLKLESTDLIPISPLNEEIDENGTLNEIENFTVPQLRSKLSELGLKVSGKKSELIERIRKNRSLNVDLEEEVNANLEDDSFEADVSNVIPLGKPVRKFSLSWKGRFVTKWLNRSFATTFFLLGLASMGAPGNLIRSLLGIFGELLVLGSSRFYLDYGGMTSEMQIILQISVAILLLIASSLYLFNRPRIAFGLVFLMMTFSLAIRTFVVVEEGIWVETLDFGPLILDIIFAIPLLVSSAIPWLAHSDMLNYSVEYQNVNLPIETTDLSEELIPEDDDASSEDMDQFAVTRPTPPRRRRPMEFFYEGIFLLIGLILWPITISTHFLLALEIPTSYGTWDMETNALTLLMPLYLLSFLATFVVIRSDREARGGALYAKEKEAYHEFMDQFLALKKAYYERQAKRLDVDDSE